MGRFGFLAVMIAILAAGAASAQPYPIQEEPPSWTVRTVEPLGLDGLDPDGHIDKVIVSPVVLASPEQPFPYENLRAQIIVICRVDGSGLIIDSTVEVVTSRPIGFSVGSASSGWVDNSDGRYGPNPYFIDWGGPPSIRVDYGSDGQVFETRTMLLKDKDGVFRRSGRLNRYIQSDNGVLYWSWEFNPDSGTSGGYRVSAHEFTRVAQSYGESTFIEMTVSAEYVGNLTFSWPLTGLAAAVAEFGGCA